MGYPVSQIQNDENVIKMLFGDYNCLFVVLSWNHSTVRLFVCLFADEKKNFPVFFCIYLNFVVHKMNSAGMKMRDWRQFKEDNGSHNPWMRSETDVLVCVYENGVKFTKVTNIVQHINWKRKKMKKKKELMMMGRVEMKRANETKRLKLFHVSCCLL